MQGDAVGRAETNGGSAPDSLIHRALPAVSMYLLVIIAGVLPYLSDRRFYLADDNSGAWLPTSRRIGELLRSGESHLFDPELWRGGNFVGSARYGVWNPLVLLLDATVLQIDDLALAMLLVTLVYLAILAGGVYLLVREYGGAPWPAALAGTVLATGGWTLWMDAAWWTPQLASFALTPWVWLAARRVAREAASPVWLFLAGAMCVSVGNPYSNVVVGLIVLAVAIEQFEPGRWRPLIGLGGSLVAIASVALFVYLPFRLTADVGFRESGISNNDWWRPGLGDLILGSSPTSSPTVPHFGLRILGFPAVYLSWFVLPLAPWLRWQELRARRFVGLALAFGVVIVLALGPSDFWLFRWPLRLVPYVHLPLVIAVAVILGCGLHRDRRGFRLGLSVGIASLGAYLSWADTPADLRWHVAGFVVVLVGVGATLWVARRWPSAVPVTLAAGTIAVLAFQLQWKPFNESVSSYQLPTEATYYEQNHGARFAGTVVQVGSHSSIPAGAANEEGAYRDLIVGSTGAIGGVETVAAYSAIGFTVHDDALCVTFDGGTCAGLWSRLFEPVGESGHTLAELLGADTIVVDSSAVDLATVTIPSGWEISEVTDHAVVWSRWLDDPWPDGRLTAVLGPVDVVEARTIDAREERLVVQRTGAGRAELVFGRLAWPGYEAFLDGRPLPISTAPAGLLAVQLPEDIDGGTITVTWSPPYWRRTLAVLLLAAVVAVATEIVWRRWRRVASDH